MAKLSQAEWKRYTELLGKLSAEAKDLFVSWVVQNGGYANIDRKAVIDMAYLISSKYAEGSSALAATLYDQMALKTGKKVAAAELAGVDYGEIAKAINGALKVSMNEEYIGGIVGRFVKQAGADTTLRNALRDGAEFAWIPSGDTCAFCLMLGANGWQTASKKVIKNGHAEHIHSNCDCNYCVRFNSFMEVEGYNPQKYWEMYQNGDEVPYENEDMSRGMKRGKWREKLNGLRRELYQENKAKIDEQKRILYEEDKMEASAQK